MEKLMSEHSVEGYRGKGGGQVNKKTYLHNYTISSLCSSTGENIENLQQKIIIFNSFELKLILKNI